MNEDKYRMKRRNIFIILLMLAAFALPAQRELTRTVTAMGSYVANQNETPAYGWAQALFDAKKQALREAGVVEDISSTTIMVMGGTENDFREISSELGRIEIEGRVRVKEQTDAAPVFMDNNLVKYSTTIRAEVVLEQTAEDLLFQFKTEGLRSTYRDGEKMTFTITPTADCYVRVFFFSENPANSAQIYPVENVFRDIPIMEGTTVAFPPNDRQFLYDRPQEYEASLDYEKDDFEKGVLLIVALKKPYPYIAKVTYENVISWLARIKRNEKRVQWHGVNIVN